MSSYKVTHHHECGGRAVPTKSIWFWAAGLMRKSVRVSDLLTHLEVLCWTDDLGQEASASDVIGHMLSPSYQLRCWVKGPDGLVTLSSDAPEGMRQSRYLSHERRIMNADLSHPIILHGSCIADGVHRLARAFLLREFTIVTQTVDAEDWEEMMASDGSIPVCDS